MAIPFPFRSDTAANWTAANPTLGQGEIGWETDTGKIKLGDGVTAWVSLGYSDIPVLPSKRGDVFSLAGLRTYINKIAVGSNFAPEVKAYTHGATCVATAYWGGAYSPLQNRIYMAPSFGQITIAIWHYIDCSTGSVIAYTHGATATVDSGYQGAVYSSTQNRIYFIPYYPANMSPCHYIDCSNGSVVTYTHGALFSVLAYSCGVYSPLQNRIYLAPYQQGNQLVWHYIDCATGSVVAYTHGATCVATAYWGGVYSPLHNRIYLTPSAQSTAVVWHYIDCDPGTNEHPSKWLMAGPLFNKSY